ncbi:MAG: FG-GAP repeat domain-containing protein [Myxococcota bacterium]
MNLKLRVAVFITAISLLSAVPVPARAAEWFSETLLQVPGNPTVVLTSDLDGDGMKDLAVFYAVSHATRIRYYIHLAVFLQKKEGFSAAPDLTTPLPDGGVAAFLAEVDPARDGEEVVLVGGKGVSTWRVAMEGGTPRIREERLTGEGSDWFGADWHGIRRVNLGRDLDGDGRDEILIPRRRELLVLRASGEGTTYVPSARLQADVFRETGHFDDPGHIIDFIDHYQMKMSETFPEIFDVDVDADGRRDLVLTYADLAATYRQLPDGSFETTPRLFRAGLTPNRDLLRSAVAPKIVTPQARDFDGDGRADLIVSRSEVQGIKGIVNVAFHRNADGFFQKKPAFRLREEVLALWPIMGDYNHDGKLDFTFLQTEFGVKAIINFLLTKRVNFNFEFFLWDGAPSFLQKPARRKGISVKFDLKEGHLSGLPLVDLTQDFNGDGLADFYAPREREAFSVYFSKPGGSKEFFSGSPDIHYHVHQSYYRRFDDLNGDGRADIVFWYQSEVGRSDLNDKVLILTSNPPTR